MSYPYPSRTALAGAQRPPKRDQRAGRGAASWIIQIIGELLITAGIFLLLYIVWQLWWTTFQVQGGMIARVDEFQTQNAGPVQTVETQETGDPPVVESVGHGEVFGVLHVPKWDWMQIPIAEGTTPDVLANGDAGHYTQSQMPGEVGNFAIAGHRRTYGNNFRRIDIMEPGDTIVVETADAWLVYEVTDHEIVLPSQVSVILPVPNEPGVEPTKRIMTMTTCHPEFGNTERYILRSEMQYWVPKSEGRPAVLADEPAR